MSFYVLILIISRFHFKQMDHFNMSWLVLCVYLSISAVTQSTEGTIKKRSRPLMSQKSRIGIINRPSNRSRFHHLTQKKINAQNTFIKPRKTWCNIFLCATRNMILVNVHFFHHQLKHLALKICVSSWLDRKYQLSCACCLSVLTVVYN